MLYQNIGSTFYSFVTKHVCDGWTDRQTDGQTELRSKDRASIAASRGKNGAIKHSVLATGNMQNLNFTLLSLDMQMLGYR